MKQSIAEKIQQRRLQILVHSCIYYVYDDSIVSDSTWNKWANELIDLQKKYPDESKEVGKGTAFSYEEFKDFDGSTGFNLPLYESFVMQKAEQLRAINRPVNKHCRDVLVKDEKYFLEGKAAKKPKTKKKISGRKLF